MEKYQDDQDRIVATGERPVKTDILREQPLSPKDERVVSAAPSSASVIIGPSSDATEQPKSSDVGGERSTTQPLNLYASHERSISYGGYGGNTGTWDGYSPYLNADGMHVVSPIIYNDNSSLLFHSGYGFNPEIAYGQYSPVATPLPSLMVDGQLYSTQVPFSPSYYPQPSPPSLSHISSAIPVSPTELMTSESSSTDNIGYGPGSGYLVNFGSFSGGDLSGHLGSSPLASPAIYPPPMGILGSYEHNVGQISHQQRPMHGYGLVSSSFSGRYPHGSSYQSSNFGGASHSYSFGNDRNRQAVDKGRRRERDLDSICIFNNSHDIFNDRNRGPRASKLKGKSASDQSSSSSTRKVDLSGSGIKLDSFNRPDFVSDYEDAKFFIIKSFSEDNVHKSIKYNVWASTPHGNRKLDAAYHEAQRIQGSCPIFLFFSVNASGQFCGVAEMVGPVDFEKDADYWQQDRWSGQFPVQWHIIKDVPNIRFRHIELENNDNKPVTHSRDCQEVNMKQGIELLKIFNDYDARTSVIDDFEFYDEREKSLKERKVRQQACSTTDSSDSLAVDSVKEIPNSFDQALQLKGSSSKEVAGTEHDISSKTEASVILEHDSVDQICDSFSQVLQLEKADEELVAPSERGGGYESESVDKKATVVSTGTGSA